MDKRPEPKGETGRRRPPRFWVFNGVLSLLFATCWIWGIDLDQASKVQWGTHQLVLIPALALLFFVGLGWLTDRLDRFALRPRDARRGTRSLPGKKLLYVFGTVAFIWFLGYLAAFPGIFATDAHFWHYEFTDPAVAISAKYSPIYAGLFTLFVEAGQALLGSWELGLSLFTLLQMSLTLFAVFRVLEFLNRYLGARTVFLAACFFALVPTHVVLSVTSAQDAPFTVCFVMCLLHLLRFLTDRDSYLSKWTHPAAFVGWGILMCILRNNGVYALALMAVTALVLDKGSRLVLLSLSLAVILTFAVYRGPIFDAFGVEKKTDLTEMMSLPLQQMAYVYNNCEELPEELKSSLLQYVDQSGLDSYMPAISDHVKSYFHSDYAKEHLGEFLSLYGKIGAVSPDGYLNGGLLQTYRLLYPGKTYPDPMTYHPYLNYLSYTQPLYEADPFVLSRHSLFPAYDHALSWLFGQGEYALGDSWALFMGFSKIPVLSTLCKAGTATWLLAYAIGYLLYQKQKKALVPLALLLGLWITVFLAPVTLYRYAAPLIFSEPLMLAMLLLPWSRSEA